MQLKCRINLPVMEATSDLNQIEQFPTNHRASQSEG